MSNDTVLSSCDQLIRYSQSVSVQLVKHAFVLPHAASGGMLPFCTYKYQAKIAKTLQPNRKCYCSAFLCLVVQDMHVELVKCQGDNRPTKC